MSKLSRKINDYMKLFPSVSDLVIDDSNRKNKRFVAKYKLNGKYKETHFSQPGAITFFDYPDMKKRELYRKRASKIINKDNKLTYMIPGTSNSFAFHILW